MSVTHTLPLSLPPPFAHLEQRFGFGDAAATWWRTFGKLADAGLGVYHRALCNSATVLQWRLLQRQAPNPRRRKYVRSGLVLHPGVASDCAEHSFVGRQGHGDDDGDVGDDDDDGVFDDDHVDDDEDDEVEECDLACRTAPYSSPPADWDDPWRCVHCWEWQTRSGASEHAFGATRVPETGRGIARLLSCVGRGVLYAEISCTEKVLGRGHTGWSRTPQRRY